MPPRTCQSYRVLIGMEIHVQLATASKMFTGAANGAARVAGAPPPPNTLVDEQVLGLPGVLPVMNKLAVEYAIKVGMALGCRIASHTKWDRKSYYYPDLPKNYQISQYDLPLCCEGTFELPELKKTVRIRRAHLEEDAGKLLHEAPGGLPIPHSIVDLNRAGTPLLEIVTEPDLSSGREVALFGQELQRLVQYLGVSGGQMQLGHMRFEPNINVHITDGEGRVHRTAITEVKNLNSFAALERACDYEVKRQIGQWVETGSLGRKSTYGWDESAGATYWQRDKEEAQDYRYFPDPDLNPVEVEEEWLDRIRGQIGELPAPRRHRYVDEVGLSPADAATLAADRATGDLFDAAVGSALRTTGGEMVRSADPTRKRIANLLLSHGRRLANERGVPLGQLGIAPGRLAELAALVEQNKLAAAEPAGLVLQRLLEKDAPAEQVAGELGLLQSGDEAGIDAAIEAVLAQNPRPLQDYLAGKQAALGALVGMVMKSSKGLNPRLVQDRLKARLSR